MADGTVKAPKCSGSSFLTTGSTASSMAGDIDRDEQALALRDGGQPFAGIARILGFDGPRVANAAFNRALRARPRAEQAQLRSREVARLDALASRVRGRDDLSVEEVVRRLNGLKHQRRTLFVA